MGRLHRELLQTGTVVCALKVLRGLGARSLEELLTGETFRPFQFLVPRGFWHRRDVPGTRQQHSKPSVHEHSDAYRKSVPVLGGTLGGWIHQMLS